MLFGFKNEMRFKKSNTAFVPFDPFKEEMGLSIEPIGFSFDEKESGADFPALEDNQTSSRGLLFSNRLRDRTSRTGGGIMSALEIDGPNNEEPFEFLEPRKGDSGISMSNGSPSQMQNGAKFKTDSKEFRLKSRFDIPENSSGGPSPVTKGNKNFLESGNPFTKLDFDFIVENDFQEASPFRAGVASPYCQGSDLSQYVFNKPKGKLAQKGSSLWKNFKGYLAGKDKKIKRTKKTQEKTKEKIVPKETQKNEEIRKKTEQKGSSVRTKRMILSEKKDGTINCEVVHLKEANVTPESAKKQQKKMENFQNASIKSHRAFRKMKVAHKMKEKYFCFEFSL